MGEWSPFEDAVLRSWYSRPQKGWGLDELAASLGRSHASVAVRASRLGLTEARGRHTRPEPRERYGSAGPANVTNPYSRARGGKRADLDGRYFRSRWEANYARYLRWLTEQGSISGWEYEPVTFRFDGVSRGPFTYTPDFRVTDKDGAQCFHEVKGWMDGASRNRLRRMAKHHPGVSVIVIGPDEYRAIQRWASVVPGWEG